MEEPFSDNFTRRWVNRKIGTTPYTDHIVEGVQGVK
jgi:hypothetical protein